MDECGPLCQRALLLVMDAQALCGLNKAPTIRLASYPQCASLNPSSLGTGHSFMPLVYERKTGERAEAYANIIINAINAHFLSGPQARPTLTACRSDFFREWQGRGGVAGGR